MNFSMNLNFLLFSFLSEPTDNNGQAAPARPSSEIKYIDEDNEETETDRLLPPTGSDESGPRTPTSSESDHSREQDSDENAPMLIRGGPNNTTDSSSWQNAISISYFK